MKKCNRCGEVKPLDEFHNDVTKVDGKRTICIQCRKGYRDTHPEEIKAKRKEYYDNGGRETRKRQYEERGGRERQGSVSMYDNKDCSYYLGIVVAERLCHHLFKDVEVMSPTNPGFDIICNKGKKIDVKSSTAYVRQNKHSLVNDWSFQIRENKVADYFICIAFDNRTDINPIHMWMIPGNEINHMPKIGISSSTIHKWDKWKRSIEEVQLCCASMKESNR